jgi:hypothetical protein
MSTSAVSYKNHRFPPQIIAGAVWLYHRFPLSLRLVEEMLLERGIVVSYETIRRRGGKFGPAYVRQLRHRRSSTGLCRLQRRLGSQPILLTTCHQHRSIGRFIYSLSRSFSSIGVYLIVPCRIDVVDGFPNRNLKGSDFSIGKFVELFALLFRQSATVLKA